MIREKIGEGQFSEVYLIKEDKGKQFVLKEYKSGFIREARREYLFLNAIRDANVVKAISFKETEKPQLILEYVEGIGLKQFKPSDIRTAYEIIIKLSYSVAQIHSLGICLNDLKPDNIILRNDDPVIIDLGLATLNFYNDKYFRGTIAYAAPEKILRKTNHPAGDVFSLGMILLKITRNTLPAEKYKIEEYTEIIKDPQKWTELIDQTIDDKFLKKILSLDPVKRPSAAEILKYYSDKYSYKIRNINEFIVKNHIFNVHFDAIEQLWKNKSLQYDLYDEIDKIVGLAVLRSEAVCRKLVILDESIFIFNPQNFFEDISQVLGQKVNSLDSMFTVNLKTINFLLLRHKNYQHTGAFDNILKQENVYVLEESKGSEIKNVSKKEFSGLLKILNLKEDLSKKLTQQYRSAKPFLVKELLRSSLMKGKKQQPIDNELINLLSVLKLPVPFSIIGDLWDNWREMFQSALQSKQIGIVGNSINFIGVTKTPDKPNVNLLKTLLMKLEGSENHFLTAQTYSLLHNSEKFTENLENHINELIRKEYYLSALESLVWTEQESHKLPNTLIKRKAFLLCKCGHHEQSLDLYESLEKELSGVERAVILSDKANVLHELKQYNQAIVLLNESAEIFLESKKITSYLRTINNIGSSYFHIKRFNEAKETFKKLLQLSIDHKNEQFKTMSYLNLADIFKQTGEWKKAFHFASNTLELGKKHNKLNIQSLAQVNIVYTNFALGNNENLIIMIQEILKTKEIKQNVQLYLTVLITFLFISRFLDREMADEIAKEIMEKYSELSDDEVRIELFFYYYSKANYLRCIELFNDLNNSHPIIEAVLSADNEKIINFLRELAIEGDVAKYLYFSLQILSNLNFKNDDIIIREIENYLELNPFSPLSRLIAEKSKKSAIPEALPIFWNIINLIHSDVEFENTMKAVLSGILEISGLERAVFFDFQNGNLQAVQGYSNEGKVLPVTDLKVSKTILKETIKLGQIRFMTNLQEDIQFDINSSIFGLGLRTAVCYPLIINNEIKGVIYSDARGDKQFKDEEKNILEAIFVQARSALDKSLMFENLKRETEILKYSGVKRDYTEIIGKSSQMMEIFALMKMVGEHNVNVLLTGPTGSGKELIAKALHKEYAKNAPFIAVNCAAIPETLLESELFGYTKGAFTGAMANKRGKIEMANKGTLFLDEIGDMPLALQSKLLRVLQERVVTPIGSSLEIPVSIRVIAATNTNIKEKVEQKEFREDLYYRLKVIIIDIPALKDRKSDIPLLIHHFIEKYNNKFNKNINGITLKALHSLQNREWKGNVRELENEIEKAVLLCRTEQLDIDVLEEMIEDQEFSLLNELPKNWKDYQEYKNRIINTLDRNFANQLLKEYDGNILQASKHAKISRTQLYRILPDAET